jgi:hypothetical protein
MTEAAKKYVKLIAKHDTWFKEGTEVYDYYSNPPNNLYRITLEQWQTAIKEAGLFVRGVRVCGDNVGEQNIGYAVGEERWDGEWCYIEEFDATIVNEKI